MTFLLPHNLNSRCLYVIIILQGLEEGWKLFPHLSFYVVWRTVDLFKDLYLQIVADKKRL